MHRTEGANLKEKGALIGQKRDKKMCRWKPRSHFFTAQGSEKKKINKKIKGDCEVMRNHQAG